MLAPSQFPFRLPLVAVAIAFACMPRNSSAQSLASDAATIVGVEEDWVLVLDQPDVGTGAPHVMTQMDPDASGAGSMAVFCVNFQDAYEFSEGGVELQLWSGDWLQDASGQQEGQRLSTSNETVSWTQFMWLEGGSLIVGVTNGSSVSLGSFGGSSIALVTTTNLSSLANYNPVQSVRDSGITLGSNRVKQLKLAQVRFHYSNGEVVMVTQERRSYYTVERDDSNTTVTTKTLDSSTSDFSLTDSYSLTSDLDTTFSVDKTTATLGSADY